MDVLARARAMQADAEAHYANEGIKYHPGIMPEMIAEIERLREELSVHHQFLHNLQMYAEVVMKPSAVQALISNACDWSYAHRMGNGEFSDEEQQRIIDRAFKKLLNVP